MKGDDGRIGGATMFYPQPMPAPLDPRKSPSIGSRRSLPTQNVGGGNVAYDLNTTLSLLELRGIDWGPWAITLDAMQPSVSPWPGPRLSSTGLPRVVVTFGVGGQTRTVEFDYPYGGATFVLNTDNANVGVRATVPDPHNPTLTPSVGAWAVPGAVQAVSTPMMLTEADSAAAGTVPAFARSLLVSAYNPGGVLPAGQTTVLFSDTSGVPVYGRFAYVRSAAPGPGFFRVPVPPLASRFDIVDTSATNWSALWEISLT